MLLNIHTHHSSPGAVSIINVHKDFDQLPATGFFSAGLHPWYIHEETYAAEISRLEKALQLPNVPAVGECGLDKVCDTDYTLQQNCFRRQVQLASQYKKPLIIHCVKAFDDVLRILKEMHVSVPVIFHGFNKSAALAAQLLNAGHYLSFGQHILQPAMAMVFQNIPTDRLFLETDAADTGITAVYDAAAAIRACPVEELDKQIHSNAAHVFGINFS